jgi:hypothetical protein
MSAALPPHRRPSVGRCGLLGWGAPNFLGKGDRLNSEGVYTPVPETKNTDGTRPSSSPQKNFS